VTVTVAWAVRPFAGSVAVTVMWCVRGLESPAVSPCESGLPHPSDPSMSSVQQTLAEAAISG
jgi:hypothetical protein